MIVSVDSSCVVKKEKSFYVDLSPNTITVDFHLTSNSVSVHVWLVYSHAHDNHARTHAIRSKMKS